MKKWSFVKILGMIGAVILISFGSMGNFLRTIRLGWDRISQK
jgi:hypothetical protein